MYTWPFRTISNNILCFCALLSMFVIAGPASATAPGHSEQPHLHRPPHWYEQHSVGVPRHPPDGADLDAGQAGGAPASGGNLTYHGGSVMLTSAAYAIYWAPGSNTISSSYQALINRFFNDVGGSSLYNILTQYYEGSTPSYIQNVATLGGSWVDTVNPYPHAGTGADPLLDADIRAEVVRAIAANGWPNGGLNAVFFVFTAKGVESCVDATDCTIGTQHPTYCAYHWSFFSGSSDVIAYANMPYAGTWVSGYPYSCGFFSQPPNNNEDADLEISITSHEQFETVTDLLGDAWFDSSGSEIGDKCAYTYGSVGSDGRNVTLNGNPYIVQQEWSNASNGCVLTYAGGSLTPSPTPTNTVPPTRTATRTPTRTAAPTNTPVAANTPQATATATTSPTPTNSPVSSNTPTLTPSSTITSTPTATRTPTATLTPTRTPTRTPTKRGKHH